MNHEHSIPDTQRMISPIRATNISIRVDQKGDVDSSTSLCFPPKPLVVEGGEEEP